MISRHPFTSAFVINGRHINLKYAMNIGVNITLINKEYNSNYAYYHIGMCDICGYLKYNFGNLEGCQCYKKKVTC